ncbi:hypothetical protein F4809DRAFT_248907 [Biscogniauxia mediterranea]|nr:hypothetical protein F4809DRAFT_248907 [Biscogniauxia mediterranea]
MTGGAKQPRFVAAVGLARSCAPWFLSLVLCPLPFALCRPPDGTDDVATPQISHDRLVRSGNSETLAVTQIVAHVLSPPLQIQHTPREFLHRLRNA